MTGLAWTQPLSALYAASITLHRVLRTSPQDADEQIVADLEALRGVVDATIHSDSEAITVTCAPDADVRLVRRRAARYGFDRVIW